MKLGGIFTNKDSIYIVIKDIYIGWQVLVLDSFLQDKNASNSEINQMLRYQMLKESFEKILKEDDFIVIFKWKIDEKDGYLGQVDNDIFHNLEQVNDTFNDQSLVTKTY